MSLDAVRFGPKAVPTGSWSSDNATGRYSPTAATGVVKQVIFCNSGSASTVTFGVSSTGSETSVNRIFNAQAIAANETITFNTNIYMSSSDRLYFYCAAGGSVSVTINAYEE